jgi:hypothetical protein
VHGLVPLGPQPFGQTRGQIGVDEKPHAAPLRGITSSLVSHDA